jgi:uncharacterized protein
VYPAAVPTPLDHMLAFLLAVLFPLRGVFFGMRRLRRALEPERPRVRLRVYRDAMAMQVFLLATTLTLWTRMWRPWDGLGLVPHAGRWAWLTAVAVIAALSVPYAQLLRVRRDDGALARVGDRLGLLALMLPHDDTELRRFRWLAVVAGVCEEVLYRGYLFWYAAQLAAVAQASFGWPSPERIPFVALLASSLAFGLGHAYQGVRGVLTTTAVGLLLSLVYVGTGSLYLGMMAHALLDIHAGMLARAALGRRTSREGSSA